MQDEYNNHPERPYEPGGLFSGQVPAEHQDRAEDQDVASSQDAAGPPIAWPAGRDGKLQAEWVPAPSRPPRRRRRLLLPLVLFVATCVSTFWSGVTGWNPVEVWLAAGDAAARAADVAAMQAPGETPVEAPTRWDFVGPILAGNYRQGLLYMGAVLAILLMHEMGHFVAALWHRIPASLPFFLPVPISPFGTMGAVIGMDGRQADRRQMFDTGLAGPLAGLVVAVPVLWLGIQQADVFPMQQVMARGENVVHYQDPLLVQWMIAWLRPDLADGAELQMNALLMAGWVGMLITGLNMMPVSQLDGGHVSYALFGRRAHLLARLVILGAVVFMFLSGTFIWLLMVVLVSLIGTDHPPTANDRAPLGKFRWALGALSLLIPVLCFPPMGMRIIEAAG